MNRFRLAVKRHRGLLCAIALCLSFSHRAAAEPAAPEATAGPVDFAHEIVPILQKRCAKCHAGTQHKGGFSINTRQTLLSGGDGGPSVVAGKSQESDLLDRLTSEDAGYRMPPEGERLSKAHVAAIRRWVDQNIPWEDGFAFGKVTRQALLAPRQPAPPEIPGLQNPVDRFLQPYFAAHGVVPGELVADAVFARRAAYDLIGLPADHQEMRTLEDDKSPNKRAQFVDRLLENRHGYAAHWMTFWNDLLRNAYHGTGFIDGGRKQITGWLYAALHENRPYDRFVVELVNPASIPGAEGFTYGIKWRGTVNESQRREIQAAQAVSQVFLGTNLKCASCHDSFVNHWKLTEAYALASVFADAPLELHRCDQPTGTPAGLGFLYPELGTIDTGLTRPERQKRLAELLTDPRNGRFTRTIVNRLWAKLFGRGLVEPLDNMDAEPWHQDLLDYLAADLAAHEYDLKRTLRLLATSRAYQLTGVGQGTAEDSAEGFVFRGPLVKRLSAEQFVDTVFTVTGAFPAPDPAGMTLDGRGQGGQLGAIATALAARLTPRLPADYQPFSKAQWIWSTKDAQVSAAPGTVFLRHEWSLSERPVRAVATFTADNSCELWINGKSAAKSDNWSAPRQVDVTHLLTAGRNVLALAATNGGDSPNPAGAIADLSVLSSTGAIADSLVTDASWKVAAEAPTGWQQPEFSDESWAAAIELGNPTIGPWEIARRAAEGAIAEQSSARLPDGFRVRAALLPLDTLQSALGRPNREQIVSSRDTVPTMLQALELTNGKTLEQLVQAGGQHWSEPAKGATGSGTAIEEIYWQALGRKATAAEQVVATEMLGPAPTEENLEDLLWTIFLLPEFQLVP